MLWQDFLEAECPSSHTTAKAKACHRNGNNCFTDMLLSHFWPTRLTPSKKLLASILLGGVDILYHESSLNATSRMSDVLAVEGLKISPTRSRPV